MELLNKLGIDWKLLLAQMVNFLVLMAVLYKFLYKPVLKILDDREKKVAKSLKQVEDIEKNLFESQGEKAKILMEARNEAGRVVAESRNIAEAAREEIINKARLEAASAVETGKKELQSEKEIMMKEIKKETADIITVAAEKILREKINAETDKKLIEKSL